MAGKAIYAHGELDAVKKRIGPLSEEETRKMQAVLGGEIGRERSEFEESKKRTDARGRGAPSKKPARVVETVESGKEQQGGGDKNKGKKPNVEASFGDRVRMDVLCGDSEFGIKTWFQVMCSRFSFFKTPADLVSPWFVRHILSDYCAHLNFLVTQTRMLFPRNNLPLGEKLKTMSLFSFKVLDTIRRWNIEVIESEKGRLQRRKNNVVVQDFSTLIYEIYKPVYILECLEINPHIEMVYNTLYRLLFLENPSAETEKKKVVIAKTIAAFQFVCKDMHRRFYPIFLKLVSPVFYFYDDFFIECEDAVQGFLGVTVKDHILPPKDTQTGELPAEGAQEQEEAGENAENAAQKEAEAEQEEEGNRFSPAEQKAFNKGLVILDSLFPKAGWLDIDQFPDLIPYFSDVKSLPKGSELIAPEDPSGIVLVLASVIEELLYGFRKIHFKSAGDPANQGDDEINVTSLDSILDDWQKLMEEAFERHYIPLIQECSQISQHVNQRNKNTPYIMKNRSAVHWTRRYYFFPYYEYMDKTPPPFKKSEINAFYPFVRNFRKKLTALAASIDRAMKSGGRANGSYVDGIGNPWDGYVFQIENPLSRRLSMLLARNQRDNVSLIFFTLAIVTVLDDLMNDEGSFVYNVPFEKIFRTGEDGETPVVWVEKVANTMDLFKSSALQRAKK